MLAVDGLLDHRLAYALRQPAVNLSFDDERIDQVAGVIDGHELQQFRLARVAIDLEHRDVAAERVRVVRGFEKRLFAQAGFESFGERHRYVGVAGDIGK